MSYCKMEYTNLKNNFDYIMNLPAVRELIMKNEKLMRKNKELKQVNKVLVETIYNHTINPSVKPVKRTPLRTQSTTKPEPNIKYEIVSEDKGWSEPHSVQKDEFGQRSFASQQLNQENAKRSDDFG